MKKAISIFTIILLILALSCFLFFVYPALTKLKENNRKHSCFTNLSTIGLALRMYSNDNNEQFPHLDGLEGLELLRKSGFGPPLYFTCPSAQTIPQKTGVPLTEETCDYIYRGGYSENDDAGTALVYDKNHNHNKFGNILFIDGHAKGYAGADWKKNINPNKKNSRD